MGKIQVLTQSEVDTPSANTLKEILFQKDHRVISIDSESTVTDAVSVMVDSKIGAVLVMENGQLVGVFTERDLMHRVVHAGLSPQQTGVKEVMTKKIIKGQLFMSVHDAASLMSENRIRHLPVFHEEQLVGIVSPGDLIAWKLKQSEQTIHQMEEYFLH